MDKYNLSPEEIDNLSDGERLKYSREMKLTKRRASRNRYLYLILKRKSE